MTTYSGPPDQRPSYSPTEDYTINLAYDIDSTHSGSVLIRLESLLAWADNDHVVLDSLLAAITSSPDWTFIGGTRPWISEVEEITP